MEQKDNDNRIAEDDAAGSAPPPNGRIPLIKIKIPKKVDEEAAAAAAEEVKSHYCKECNKSFSSGKALGGHMSSAHVQANKDYSLKKLSSKRKPSGSYSGSANNACMLCGRVFQSKKSLFGHMRCHPEREWRGMEPPPETKIDSADASSEDDEDGGDQIDSAHELGFNLKGWPTSKRGRGPVTNPVIRAAPDSGSETFVAGLELIKMLKGESINGPKLDPKKPRGDAAVVIDDGRREMESNGKGKEKLPENQESETSISIDPNEELYATAIEVLMSVKREKRVMEEIKDSGTASSSPEKYKCNECGRIFSTHQALGGHRSSHNKFKMSVVNTNNRGHSELKMKKKKKKKKENVVAEMQTSSAERASASAFAFAFDLNMAPAEDEDEDMEDSSNS